jgi:hypothetical protein
VSVTRTIVRNVVRPVVRRVEGGEEAGPDVTIQVELTADDGAYLLADDGITQLTAD